MGAAATQRGNALIRRNCSSDIDAQIEIEQLIKAEQIAEECNLFVREVMDLLTEPKGLREKTITWAKTRKGWTKRQEKLRIAHANWVDGWRTTQEKHFLCVERAKAAYELVLFALGTWTIPEKIKVPRCVR